jgi:organic hydroperoxide reductase OsmC/OhrA
MQAFPHRYSVAGAATACGDVALSGDCLPTLSSAPPKEFDGPGDRWSPEALLVAAVAGCYVMTFRAVAGIRRLLWTRIACEAVGVVERVDRVTQFTEFRVRVRLEVPIGTDLDLARQLLSRAEHACLITNSLKARTHLDAEVVVSLQGRVPTEAARAS